MVSVEYFLDSLQLYEARDIAKNIVYVDRTSRELQRYQLYVSVQSHSKNKLTPKEILELPWDDNFLDQKEFTYSTEEEEKTVKMAQSFEDMLNAGALTFEETNLMKKKE